MLSLATGMACDLAIAPYQGKQTGETALFRQLMGRLRWGDIVVSDRYRCTPTSGGTRLSHRIANDHESIATLRGITVLPLNNIVTRTCLRTGSYVLMYNSLGHLSTSASSWRFPPWLRREHRLAASTA
jgi:hypothetical protein